MLADAVDNVALLEHSPEDMIWCCTSAEVSLIRAAACSGLVAADLKLV